MIMSTGGGVLCWNCRGAVGRGFACEIKELLREQKPKIVILLEPRINGETATNVCQKLGKKRLARSESMGFSGGIWVFWEDEEVALRLAKVRRSYIHMEVRFGKADGILWRCTPTPNPTYGGIYGSNWKL